MSFSSLSPPIKSLLDEVIANERIRVWSIIITFFGDCIVPRGGQVTLGSLLEVMSLFQIEANAVRTALSRLVKDGLLERHKHGRHSSYRLAGAGESLFQKASNKIYAVGPSVWEGQFEFALVSQNLHQPSVTSKDATELLDQGYGSPMSGVYMRPVYNTVDPSDVSKHVRLLAKSIGKQSLNVLVQAAWPMRSLNKQYSQLMDQFSRIDTANLAAFNPQDCLALRVMLLHAWRRLILKDVDLPAELKIEGWNGEVARNFVALLYHELLPQSEYALERLEATPGILLNGASQTLTSRFKI